MIWLTESGSSIVSSKADKTALSRLTPLSSNLVNVPRVAETPVKLECRYLKSVRVQSWEEKERYFIVLGEVVRINFLVE